MNSQATSGSVDPHPLLTVDEEGTRREMAQHTSLHEAHMVTAERKEVITEIVLAPAIGIVSEEEEAAPIIVRSREYSHSLVCCRNQLGLGMHNPGPR